MRDREILVQEPPLSPLSSNEQRNAMDKPDLLLERALLDVDGIQERRRGRRSTASLRSIIIFAVIFKEIGLFSYREKFLQLFS